RRGAKINFSGHFTAAIRQPSATGIRGSNRNYRPKREKGDPSGPPSSDICRRSKVERHACGRSLDGCATDGVVGSIARADLVAMTARAKTVVRTHTLREH